MNSRKTAEYGAFLGIALILSYVESLINFAFGVPGMKLGLPNLCIILVLYIMGPGPALLINIMRILLSGFMFGNMFSIIYSLSGGLVSFLLMLLLKKSMKFSLMTVSTAGGIFHNIGQLLIAALVISNFNIFLYGPLLIASGAVTGALIGIIAGEVLKRLNKIKKD